MTQVSLSAAQTETLEVLGSQLGAPQAIYPPQVQSQSRAGSLIAPSSKLPIYAGITAMLAGFVLIFVAWVKVAGLSNVDRQIPYLISAGFTGLGLVMSGLVVINISVRRQDGAERERQMSALTEALGELQHSLRP